ncbi:MAG: polyketide cyclase [Gordonia sp.]|nr:polyketide cyclase [Gordonia sp. (in: high G+C Gram-positive bacteria)]
MTEIPSPVQRLIDATNAGDTSAFLAGFTEDGAVDDWGRTFRGSDAITDWSNAEFIGKQVTLDITTADVSGHVTTIVAQVGGNGFNGPSTFGFTTAGDLVSLMTITG